MKFSIAQKDISTALKLVSRAASSGGQLPVLGNVLLTVQGDTLSLSATNLEISLTNRLLVEKAEDGSITIPAKLLSAYVDLCRGETVKGELVGDALKLTAKGSKTSIKGLPADEFPALPDVTPTSTVTVPSSQLADALGQTAFACAVLETRPVLTGVLFEVGGGTLTLTATDSYRLARSTLTTTGKKAKPASFIVPAKTISHLASILKVADAPATVSVGKHQAAFSAGELRLTTRLIEGAFPPVDAIIPKASTTTATFVAADLLLAVRRASLFAEFNRSIQLTVQPMEGQVVLHAAAAELGGETATVGATVEGKEVEIAFNAQYLIDALANLDAASVTVSLDGSGRPGVLRPADRADCLHVVMPLKR